MDECFKQDLIQMWQGTLEVGKSGKPRMQNKEMQLYSKWFKEDTDGAFEKDLHLQKLFIYLNPAKLLSDVESKMKGFVLVSLSKSVLSLASL